jgi:hypothetical protein
MNQTDTMTMQESKCATCSMAIQRPSSDVGWEHVNDTDAQLLHFVLHQLAKEESDIKHKRNLVRLYADGTVPLLRDLMLAFAREHADHPSFNAEWNAETPTPRRSQQPTRQCVCGRSINGNAAWWSHTHLHSGEPREGHQAAVVG